MVGGLEVHVEAVDLDQPLALVDAQQGAADRDLAAVGQGAADRDQVAVVGALGVRHEAYGGAALGGQQRHVDVGDGALDDPREDALERGQLEHLDVVVHDLAADLDVDRLRDLAGERR